MAYTVLQRSFISSIIKELGMLNGTEFEGFCQFFMQIKTNEEIQDIGHNLCAKPIGYRADLKTTDYELIGQCGTDLDYFGLTNLKAYNNLKGSAPKKAAPAKKAAPTKKTSKASIPDPKKDKPISDFYSAIKNHPNAKEIFLFANKEGSDADKQAIQDYITKNNPGITVHVIDVKEIAETLCANIVSDKVGEALKILPASHMLYRIYSKKHKLPDFNNRYFETSLETNIIDELKNKGIIEIFGISGIGKSELAKKVVYTIEKDFDTVLWFDCNLIGTNINFESIKLDRFNQEINLKYILENFKCLLVFDNLNDGNTTLLTEFQKHNKSQSLCLITSLSQHYNKDKSTEIGFRNLDFIERFFSDLKTKPSKEQLSKIEKSVGGHPLVLNLIKSLINTHGATLSGITNDLRNITASTDDERSEKVAERLIGKYLPNFTKELEFLIFCKSLKISRPFALLAIGELRIIELKKRSLIKEVGSEFIEIHSLVANSIKELIPRKQFTTAFKTKLKQFLIEQSYSKKISFYSFMFTHSKLIEHMLASTEDELKKVLIYSRKQSKDLKVNQAQLYKEISSFNLSKNTEIDILLLIEKYELELIIIDKKKDEPKHKKKALEQIKKLKGILSATKSPKIIVLINHHIGKIYNKIDETDNSIKYFDEVLKLKPDYSPTLLQLLRIYKKKNDFTSIRRIVDQYFDSISSIEDESVSVLLSFYFEISNNSMEEFRKKYIDKDVNLFIDILGKTSNKEFDLPFRILENLSDHLSYNNADEFNSLLANLPYPANIDSNKDLMKAYARIQLAYYKFLKFKTDNVKTKEIMDKTYAQAEKFFIDSKATDDFTLRKLAELYTLNEDYANALKTVHKLSKQDDPFVLQSVCKAKRGIPDLVGSLDAINNAIKKAEGDANFKKGYIAAFYNDKAETQRKQKNKECLLSLQKAIDLQTTPSTKDIWEKKIIEWRKEFP